MKGSLYPIPRQGLRRGFAVAVVAAAASCSADSLPGRPLEASGPAALEAKPSQVANLSSGAMPKDLRTAYISAVQQAASEAYAAMATQPGAPYPVQIDPLMVTQQGQLYASDGAAGDNCGYSVAVSGDTALVGAHLHDAAGMNSGAAYVFVRSGGVWTQQAKLLAGDGIGGEYFGYSVALSGDTALVGAYRDDDKGFLSGSAYVFVRSGGVWTQQAKLVASDGTVDAYFGVSVALSGDTALVGASQTDDNGIDSGSAYVFVRSGSVWTQQAKIVAGDGTQADAFGNSVALSADTALVGAYGDDDKGLVSGSAYVFVRSGSVWTQQAKLVPSDGASGDRFGNSVALWGNTALVGAFGDDDKGIDSGSLYVFSRSGSVWAQEVKLFASDGAAGDAFGYSVAFSAEVALVGGYQDDDKGTDAGSAYVFSRSGSLWTEQGKIVANNGAAGDQFGGSVALSVDTAIVGARLDDDLGTDSGSAYAYLLQGVKPNGQPCAMDAECLSGFCVDGDCCNTSCGGGVVDDCQACSVAAGATMDGACGLAAQGTSCRPAAGICDAPEECNGVSGSCPADAKAAANTECRASGGVCDLAEVCDGVSEPCPADAKVAANTECRAAAGVCDVAEACDGAANDCPTDMKVAAGTECRAAMGPCDIAESCNESDVACPVDGVAGVTTDCRPAAGLCDIPEKCDGVSKTCMPDVLASQGALCRPVAGECDIAETCSGISVNCPPDGSAPNGTTCTGGVCTGGVCMSGSGGSGGAGGGSTSGNSSTSSGSGGSGGSSGSGGGSDSGGAGGGSTSSSNSSAATGGSTSSGSGEPGEEGGCACRTAGGTFSDSSHAAGGAFGLIGLGVIAMRRRRGRRMGGIWLDTTFHRRKR